jgi:DNA replication protein DnaC
VERPAECPFHGNYVALVVPWVGELTRESECPECSAEREKRERVAQIQRAATIAVGDAFFGIYAAEAKRRWRLAHLSELAMHAGVMPEHAAAELSDFARDAQTLAAGVLDGQSSLLVLGPVGTGKTRLAAAIARESIRRGAKPAMHLARTLFRRLWSTYREGAVETEDHVIEHLTTAELLVIDDIAHKGRPSDAVISVLHEILTIRIGFGRPTVVTTNLTLEEIGRHYRESIRSRLGSWPTLVMRGRDWRAA